MMSEGGGERGSYQCTALFYFAAHPHLQSIHRIRDRNINCDRKFQNLHCQNGQENGQHWNSDGRMECTEAMLHRNVMDESFDFHSCEKEVNLMSWLWSCIFHNFNEKV